MSLYYIDQKNLIGKPIVTLYPKIKLLILYKCHFRQNTIFHFSNQSNVTESNEPDRVRLSSAVNATDCDCSYHSKKNRAVRNTNDGESEDEDDDSDIDDA